MSKAIPYCRNPTFLNKKQLINLKTKAMRSGAWFKALQRIDRVLFDLTIRVVDNIRSSQISKKYSCAYKEAGERVERQLFETVWLKLVCPLHKK